MLYELHLPESTKQYLTDLVYIQYDLLAYATRSKHLLTASGKMNRKTLIEECTRDINLYSTHSKSYGQQIANDFFNNHIKLTEGRVKLLQDFALAYQQDKITPAQDKNKWIIHIYNEITQLFPSSTIHRIQLQVFIDENEITKAWQEATQKFLLYFYENFLGGLDKKIPAGFLLSANQENNTFGRLELIEDFHEANPDLEMCTMCDESKFYTRYSSSESNKKKEAVTRLRSHATLDHYLPKDLYPHLCCHPYNLIPICHACNSSIKGKKHPINGKRKYLNCAALPYRGINLSVKASLHVDLHASSQAPSIASIQKLAARPRHADPSIEEAIEILSEIYKMPDRWNEKRQITTIIHALFRRIRHFLTDSLSNPLVENIDHEIYNKLKQLLYYLDKEDQRHDPYGFAMTWMLAAFLKEYDNAQESKVWQALVQEIRTCFQETIKQSEAREEYVEDLLRHAPISPQKLNSPTEVTQPIYASQIEK